MDTPVLIDQVWKSFGPTAAVRGLSLSVPRQSVYGFLGPNGAGKSTTIRMILGLQRPDRGRIDLFGSPLATAALRRVGSLVENPSLYLHLTGRENLEIHRRLLDLPKPSIDHALQSVDLLSAADRLARTYSTGMKQRLGLAIALLGDPELLLLDEPTNGLDPAGIHEVRNVIRDLPKRRGITVFLSSHLLSEVEQTATHFAILSRGQLKFEGTPATLRQRDGGNEVILVDVEDSARAHALLLQQCPSLHLTRDGDRLTIHSTPEWPASKINRTLVQQGFAVSHLATTRQSLEDAFLELTEPELTAQ